MKRAAIIIARGGSKRIPRKNIKEFCGRPIIEYSISAALESQIFDEVMVSTDDLEIADISKKAGANVPFLRSDKTSDDYATTADVVMEVLTEYKNRGIEFDYVACIYPTAPFVTSEKLKNGMKVIEEKDGLMLMPVTKFSFPPQRCVVINNDTLEYKWPQYRKTRSQDLEPMYYECGQYYIYNVKRYMEKNGQIEDGIIPVITPQMEVQDIDNEEDWEIAELKYSMFIKKNLNK